MQRQPCVVLLAINAFQHEGSAAGAAVDESTTTGAERRLMDTAVVDSGDMTSSVARSGVLGAVLLALLAFLYEASAARAAVDGSTTTADARRLMDTTMVDNEDMTSAAARSGGLAAVLLTLLAFLYVGRAAAAAVDGSTATADEHRLIDATMVDSDDIANAAACSGGLGAVLLALLAFPCEASAARAAVDGATTTGRRALLHGCRHDRQRRHDDCRGWLRRPQRRAPGAPRVPAEGRRGQDGSGAAGRASHEAAVAGGDRLCRGSGGGAVKAAGVRAEGGAA